MDRPSFLQSMVFSEKKVKCAQKSYHSFSDNDINYKPSMKNVQSFHVIRFFVKKIIFAKGAFYPTYGVKRPPDSQSNLL